jgi:hypothetical protein
VGDPKPVATTLDTIVTSDDDPRMRYPGGKGKCFQRLINLMPPHTAYIESHLGGGAVMRHKLPATVNVGVDADAQLIDRWRRELPDVCQLVHGDAAGFLRRYPFKGGELVYADPPYVPAARRRARVYRHDYTDAHHAELLRVLTSLPCMVMVSGYGTALYDHALAGWRRAQFDAMSHSGPRLEVVWMNYPPPPRLHDASFIGDTYRDRQSVKRRHARLLVKFKAMDQVERDQVLAVLNRQFGTCGAAT